ncbi:response regulator transcription factor [Acidithiobacillus sp.]|uniref:response regulator transcription factor n=1 Tax=Acidithiobacillus sp. TaxID=1872118 RepID=UPI003D00CB4E
MLYILLGGVVIHAAHLAEATWLAHTAKVDAPQDPGKRERILLLADPASPDAGHPPVETVLRRTGALVQTVAAIPQAERLLRKWQPQILVIVGWFPLLADWCLRLRRQPPTFQLPVLVVGSSIGQQEGGEAMEALDAGADAYLSAPLAPQLLVAQVQAMLKRAQGWALERIGDTESLCLDPVAHRVWILGQEVRLPRRMFTLLYYLAKHPDHTFSVAEITSVLTAEKGGYMQPNAVAAQVYRLRKVLGAVGAGNWLETVHGFGYRFTPPKSTQNIIRLSSR